MIAYVGIGSNLGSRVALVQAAVEFLAARFEDAQCSSLYLTPSLQPGGVVGQAPEYVNAVLRVRLPHSCAETHGKGTGQNRAQAEGCARELLAVLKQIETNLGRTRNERWASRTLDLDLLRVDHMAGELVLSDPELTLPHPEVLGRAFVLAPLLDVFRGEAAARKRFETALGELAAPQVIVAPAVVREGSFDVVGPCLDALDAAAYLAAHVTAWTPDWQAPPSASFSAGFDSTEPKSPATAPVTEAAKLTSLANLTCPSGDGDLSPTALSDLTSPSPFRPVVLATKPQALHQMANQAGLLTPVERHAAPESLRRRELPGAPQLYFQLPLTESFSELQSAFASTTEFVFQAPR